MDEVVALDSDDEIGKLPRLDSIADTIGGPTTAKLLDKVKPGGTIGSVVGAPAGPACRSGPSCGRLRSLRVRVASVYFEKHDDDT